MSLIEEMRLLLRQVCGTVGITEASANVVSLVVLGVAFNAVALSVVKNMRVQASPVCAKTMLQSAARTELKVARTMVITTVGKFGDTRGWCLASA